MKEKVNEVIGILRKVKSILCSVDSTLNSMALNKGCLTKENEKKILKLLEDKVSLKKEEIMVNLGVSRNNALDIMKRISGKKEEIIYVQGSGKKPSTLFQIGTDIISQKSKLLIDLMPRASTWKREEIMEKLDVSNDLINEVVNVANNIKSGEFKWDIGKLLRMR